MSRLLTVNAGSSSTKCSIIESPALATLTRLELPAPGDPSIRSAIADLVSRFTPDASVHRIVHGGSHFSEPAIIDDTTEARLEAIADLAPLHNPPALGLLELLRGLMPTAPCVACFDTTFFTTLPPEAHTFALPEQWRDEWGIRRYGFHGLSHAWATGRIERVAKISPADARVVTAHLGSGASLAAVQDGSAVDTTMGFTPLDGLVMATRPGSIDPGIAPWLLRRGLLTPEDLDEVLEHRSGLLSLAGTTDLRHIIEAAYAQDDACRLAYEVYLHRLRSQIAAMAAAMGGLDVLAFTGGAGQSSEPLRKDACDRLGFLGIFLDEELNGSGEPDRLVSRESGPGQVRVVVVESREDLQMALEAEALLSDRRP